jgi:hypothetical protein
MDSTVFSAFWDDRDVMPERLDKNVTEQPLRTEHGVWRAYNMHRAGQTGTKSEDDNDQVASPTPDRQPHAVQEILGLS